VDIIISILALAGIVAAVWHLVRAAFRFLRQGADGLWTGEVARNHARRGDVTALQDARREQGTARRGRTRAGAEAVGWLILLVVPPLTPWGTHIYASYVVLWLVPVLQRRRS
jgi:hypothetical protein